MKTEIYSHFHPDERPFIDKVLEWISNAEQAHEVKRTDFLDPRQQFILQTLANSHLDIQLKFNGGYEGAERKRAWIAPDYRVLEEDDFAIQVLSISSDDAKLGSLDHGDYMGSILGLGLKRDKIGDIHVIDQGCHCLAASETIEYLNLQLHQVHRVNVSTEVLTLDKLQCANVVLEEQSFTVASLRLDGIVSDAVRQSRNKIMAPIKSGKCRVNWKVEIDPSKPLKEGDMISLKGFGRFKLLEVSGLTKKGRVHVKIGKFV
jgi:RNA-binding protein YlmH